MSAEMSRGDCASLQGRVKRRAKAACAEVDALAAQRRAEVEAEAN